MTEHFKCHDCRGRLIICERGNWEKHAEKHAEINNEEDAVVSTLETPLGIYQDVRHLNRQVYYRPNILQGDFNRWYLRIVIEFRQTLLGKRGYFVTAFAVTPGDVPRRGEVIIWPSQDETTNPLPLTA